MHTYAPLPTNVHAHAYIYNSSDIYASKSKDFSSKYKIIVDTSEGVVYNYI